MTIAARVQRNFKHHQEAKSLGYSTSISFALEAVINRNLPDITKVCLMSSTITFYDGSLVTINEGTHTGFNFYMLVQDGRA